MRLWIPCVTGPVNTCKSSEAMMKCEREGEWEEYEKIVGRADQGMRMKPAAAMSHVMEQQKSEIRSRNQQTRHHQPILRD